MSAFWDWAVHAYARPGAAEACLELQDAHGQNVPLLLWTLWRSRAGAPPDDPTLAAGARAARAWEGAAVAPLRTLRRDLKAEHAGVGAQDREAVRSKVKAVELEAERRLMAALEALGDCGGADGGGEAALLARASAAWGAPLPPEAFTALLARL